MDADLPETHPPRIEPPAITLAAGAFPVDYTLAREAAAALEVRVDLGAVDVGVVGFAVPLRPRRLWNELGLPGEDVWRSGAIVRIGTTADGVTTVGGRLARVALDVHAGAGMRTHEWLEAACSVCLILPPPPEPRPPGAIAELGAGLLVGRAVAVRAELNVRAWTWSLGDEVHVASALSPSLSLVAGFGRARAA